MMKSMCFTAAAAVCMAAGVAAHADDQTGWYSGAGLGRSHASDSGSIGSTVDNGYASQGLSSGTSVERNDTAWRLLGGYQFNRYVGVEGSFGSLGDFSTHTNVTAPAADTAGGKWKATNVWTASVVGTLPLYDRISAFGELGLAYAKVSMSTAAPLSGAALSASTHETVPMFGLGLKYDLTKQLGLRGEWQRFDKLGSSASTGESNVNVLSAAVQYRY